MPFDFSKLNAPAASAPPPSDASDYTPIFVDAGVKNNVDPDLLRSIADGESGKSHNRWAIAPDGGQGVMQLMPKTAEDLGVTRPFEAEQNIHGGAKYYAEQLEKFKDPYTAAMAYNAGPGGDFTNPKVRQYADRVMSRWDQYREQRARQTPPPASASPPAPSGFDFSKLPGTAPAAKPAAEPPSGFDFSKLPGALPPAKTEQAPAQPTQPAEAPKTEQPAAAEPPAVATPGLLQAGTLGVVGGVRENVTAGRQAVEMARTGKPGAPPKLSPEEEALSKPIDWLSAPSWAGVSKGVYQLTKGVTSLAPEMGAAVVGGVAGAAAGSELGPGALLTGAAGAGLAAGTVSAAKEFAPLYYEELTRLGPGKENEAFTSAIKRAGTTGAGTALSFALFEGGGWALPFLKQIFVGGKGLEEAAVSAGLKVTKEGEWIKPSAPMKTQIPAQAGVAVGEQAAQNVEQGKPITDDLANAAIMTGVGLGAPALAHLAVRGVRGRGAPAGETGTETPPGDTGTPPGGPGGPPGRTPEQIALDTLQRQAEGKPPPPDATAVPKPPTPPPPPPPPAPPGTEVDYSHLTPGRPITEPESIPGVKPAVVPSNVPGEKTSVSPIRAEPTPVEAKPTPEVLPPSPAPRAEPSDIIPTDADTTPTDSDKTTKPPRQPKAVTPFEPVPKQPQRLISFLKQDWTTGEGIHQVTNPGGIVDTGGDLKAIFGGTRGRPGFINSKGMSLQNAAERAWEAGYFPDHSEPPDQNTLLNAIAEDHRGNPQYSDQDHEAVQAHHGALDRNREIESLAQQYEIDMTGMNRDQFYDAVHDRLSTEEQAQRFAEIDADYAAMESAAKRDSGATTPRQTYGGKTQARTLEDLEREHRQADTAAALEQRAALGEGRGHDPRDTPAGEEGDGQAGGVDWPPGSSEAARGEAPPNALEAGRRPGLVPGQADIFGRTAPTAPAPRTAEPTIRTDPRQQAMPGMGGSAVQAQAARDATGRGGLEPKVPQQEPGGLFSREAPPQPSLPMEPQPAAPKVSAFKIATDELSQVPAHTPETANNTAKNFVFFQGRATGNEHIAIVDLATGEIIHAGTSNNPKTVAVDSPALVQLPENSLVVHHNHPNSGSFSSGDLRATVAIPSIARLVAVGENGAVYTVATGPKLQAKRGTAEGLADIIQAHEDARVVAKTALERLWAAGLVTAEEANSAFHDLISRILHVHGMIDYVSTHVLPKPVASLVDQIARRAGHAPDVSRRFTDAVWPDEGIAGLPRPVGEPSAGAVGSGAAGRPEGGSAVAARPEPAPRQQPPGTQGRLLEDLPRSLSEDDDRVPLYSGVVRAVEALKQAKGSGEQFLAMLRKAPGVKPEELRWTGVDDWLKGQKSVTKEQLQDYLREHQVDVREVVKGGGDLGKESEIAQRRADVAADALFNRLPETVEINGQPMRRMDALQGLLNVDFPARAFPEEFQSAALHAATTAEEAHRLQNTPQGWGSVGGGGTRYEDYTLPGGKNYRELLMTLPQKGGVTDEALRSAKTERTNAMADYRATHEQLGSQHEETIAARERYNDAATRTQELQDQAAKEPRPFTHPHWNEANVLAHVRFDDRVGADGKKTLLVHEIQSDWGQEGRKKGYQTKEPVPPQLNFEQWAAQHGLIDRDVSRIWAGQDIGEAHRAAVVPEADQATWRQWEQDRDANLAARERAARAVPDMPFKTSWSALAMKRITKWAADNGYDKVAWTPGQVQADRFDLSKQIAHINFHDGYSGGLADMAAPDTRGMLSAYDHDGRRVIDKHVEVSELPDLIGKEAAERLLNAEKERVSIAGQNLRQRQLSGLDLKVGGEGMKGFYDKILPTETNKIIGKFGAKVGQDTVRAEHASRDEVKPDAQAQAEHGPAWDRLVEEHRKSGDEWDRLGGFRADENDPAVQANTRLRDSLYTQMDQLHARMVDETMARGTAQPVHAFDITPSMRKAVTEEGLSLFAPAAPGLTLTPPPATPGAIKTAVKGIVDAVKAVSDSIATGLAPMRAGSTRAQAFATTFANGLRRVMFRYGMMDRAIRKEFGPESRAKMGSSLDRQSVFEQQIRNLSPADQATRRAAFDAGRTGLAGLNPRERATVETLEQRSQQLWERFQRLGMVSPNAERIPYYFSRQIVVHSEGLGFSRPEGGGTGGNRGIDARTGLSTQGPMRREHLTPEETEAAAQARFGPDAKVLTDIRSLVQRLADGERAAHGVELMNAIDYVGRETGVNLVVRGDIPGLLTPGDYFTMADHPSFRRWTGAGWQAVHVAKEFEGPLKAVLRQASPEWYNAAMKLKGGIMNSIMFSPFIHLGVEVGRALPVLPGKMLTLQVFRDGSRLRNDAQYMDTAIRDGLAPLGQGWKSDPVSIADQARMDATKLGAGQSALQGVRAVGRFMHETLLWDNIFKLQVGLYDAMKQRAMKKGFDEQSAGVMAAHIANRYAGALPPEHLSQSANMAANLLLFSRSFTLGNLGVIKDMLTGAPKHVLSRIEQMSGPEAAKSAKGALQRKAISAFVLDIGLFYGANAALQLGLQVLRQSPQAGGLGPAAQQVFNQWLDDAKQAVVDAKDNPLAIFNVLPQNWNEPGKENRVYAGNDSTGRGTYLRLPPGKVGEEFMGWMPWGHPGTMLENKLSPPVRAIMESIIGSDTLGRKIYQPHPETISDRLAIAGAVVQHIGASALPLSTLQGIGELYQHYVQGKPTKGDPYVAAAKVVGPVTGLATVSSGFPGGPGAGETYAMKQRQTAQQQAAMPGIRDKILSGDVEGARRQMLEDLKMPPAEVSAIVRMTQAPGPSRAATRQFNRTATPELQHRMEHHQQVQGGP